MLLIAAIAISITCFVLGAIRFRRGRRISGLVLVALGLLIFLAPLQTLHVTVELPPAAAR